ncbi:MAG TPA: hypothetical protein VHT91_31320 [Kofleriaceae bacterium]|jgi:hypothetical protein|nr:hypothetical protein [Kofleriaceae bacterium]
MRSPRLCLVAAVAGALMSCGGGAPQPATLSSRWSAPSILAEIPANAPYLVALLEPMNDALRRRMLHSIDAQLAQSSVTQELDKLRSDTPEPWMRAVLAQFDELRSKGAAAWFDQLGIDPRGRFVLYGMSLWPVARIELSNPAKLRAAIARLLSTAGAQPQQRTLDGRAYWLVGDRDVSFVAAVLDHEAVAAVLPTAVVDAALPEVLGIRPPERSLAATTTMPELLARHHFLGVLVGYFDAHRIVDVVAGPQPRPIDIPIRAITGPVSPDCRADLDRVAAAIPRVVLGYHRFDGTGFDASLVLETPPATVAALRKLHASVPEVTAQPAGQPLFAMGAALDPDQLIAWLQDKARQVRERPFRCPWFTEWNAAAAEVSSKLAAPLPPIWRGVRGFSVTIDDASLLPPSITGHALVAGDRVGDLVQWLAGQVPAIAGIPLTRNGQPIELPTRQLQIPVPAHFALTTDRLVIAAGEGSERRVTEHLRAPAPRTSPLFTMRFNVPRLQEILASFGQKPMDNLSSLRDVGIGLDVDDTGISFDVSGTWLPEAPPAQIAAPPARP